MACKPSDALDSLRESARRGDWRNARHLAEALARTAPPADPRELENYLIRLKETVIVARASRANAAATLVRLRAAANFNRSLLPTAAGRQNPGESPDFRRPASPPVQPDQ
jgi:hypothetical protein